MEDFSQYNQDFNNEFTCGTDWMDLHLNTLFLELQDIYTATYIFRVVDSEWDKRVQEKEVPDYSTVRTILYEALVYRVILGLSKIFANNKEYSLSKTANQIEQIYKSNSEVKSVINGIRQKIDSSPMIPKIRVFRDKFFAHLDKHSFGDDGDIIGQNRRARKNVEGYAFRIFAIFQSQLQLRFVK